MKILKYVLIGVLSLSAMTASAQEAVQAPQTPQQALQQEYANLTDLQVQLKLMQTATTITKFGLIVSIGAMATGAAAFVNDLPKEVLSSAIKIPDMRKLGIQPHQGEYIFYGGAAGMVGGGILYVVELQDIAKLNGQIEIEKAKVKQAWANLPH